MSSVNLFPSQVLLAIPVLLFLSMPLGAEDNSLMSLLDGKRFEGKIGAPGKPGKIDETVVFENGQFVSAECERRCGYARSKYWFRLENNEIHFKTRIRCTRADAWIDWSGTIAGNTINGQLKWTSERWYWTTKRNFWFEGQLIDSADPVAPQS